MSIKTLAATTALLALSAATAMAQSTGASPADPNNERNQRPAMSNSQPSDPGTDTPAARVPTDPEDAATADREEGGATGESAGESGAGPVEPLPEATDPGLPPPPAETE